MHIYSILYSIYSSFSSKLTFKSWILTSEKKGPSCPNWGQGGRVRWFGQCPKENDFFSIDVFPNVNAFTNLPTLLLFKFFLCMWCILSARVLLKGNTTHLNSFSFSALPLIIPVGMFLNLWNICANECQRHACIRTSIL